MQLNIKPVMKLLALLMLIFMMLYFPSCVTEKKRAEICDKCPIISVSRDSIITVLKDTIIYNTTQGPILWLENPCSKLCDSVGNLKRFEKIEKKNGLKTTLSTKGNVLSIECDSDSLKQVIKGLESKYTFKEKNDVKTIENKENQKTSFDGFTRWWFYITASCFILYLIYLFVKSKL